ncbi:MAG: hypothetical protein ACK4E9_09940 [Aeromonas media]
MEIIAYSYKPEVGIKDMAFILNGFPPGYDVIGAIPASVAEAVYSMCESIECGYLPAKGYHLNSKGDWWRVEGTVLTADVAAWAETRGIHWPPVRREPSSNLWTLTSRLRHPAVVAWAEARGINWPRKKRMPKQVTPSSLQRHKLPNTEIAYQRVPFLPVLRRQTEANLAEKAKVLTSTAAQKTHGNTKLYEARRQAVLKAALTVYENWPDQRGDNATSWAREVDNLAHQLFENDEAPMEVKQMASLIRKAIREGILPGFK